MKLDCPTLGVLVDRLAEDFADMPAIVASDASHGPAARQRLTYRELAGEVHALQAGLEELGVRPGERVAVLLSNFAEWLVYLLAVTRMGAIFVPLNPRYGTREIGHVLDHTQARVLAGMGVYQNRDYGALIAEVAGESRDGGFEKLPSLRQIVAVRGRIALGTVEHADLLETGRRRIGRLGVPPASSDADAVAMLLYTSGTTSLPKGVPRTHAAFVPHTLDCGELLELAPGEPALTLFPFFGASGLNKIVSTFGRAACLVFQDAFRAEEAFDLVVEERCDFIHALDVQVRELSAIARARKAEGHERRGTIAFVTGVDEVLVAEMREALGIGRFIHAYGMTEVNPMVLRNRLDDPYEVQIRPGGHVAPGIELKVIDAQTGAEQPHGESGEIVIRGRTVLKEYYKDPGTTAEVIRDGWFHTGDLGVRHADGTAFYLGRLKDTLKIGGFNVAPQEVEAFLETHAAVEDAAVAGVPEDRLGEVAVAFVKLRPGATATAEELHEFCRGKIANFKIPRHFRFVDALPYHTAAHGPKLQRSVLRDWWMTSEAAQRDDRAGAGEERRMSSVAGER